MEVQCALTLENQGKYKVDLNTGVGAMETSKEMPIFGVKCRYSSWLDGCERTRGKTHVSF